MPPHRRPERQGGLRHRPARQGRRAHAKGIRVRVSPAGRPRRTPCASPWSRVFRTRVRTRVFPGRSRRRDGPPPIHGGDDPERRRPERSPMGARPDETQKTFVIVAASQMDKVDLSNSRRAPAPTARRSSRWRRVP